MNSKQWHELTKAERDALTRYDSKVTLKHSNKHIQQRIDQLKTYRIAEFGTALAMYKVISGQYPKNGFTQNELDQMNADTLPIVLPNDTVLEWS